MAEGIVGYQYRKNRLIAERADDVAGGEALLFTSPDVLPDTIIVDDLVEPTEGWYSRVVPDLGPVYTDDDGNPVFDSAVISWVLAAGYTPTTVYGACLLDADGLNVVVGKVLWPDGLVLENAGDRVDLFFRYGKRSSEVQSPPP